MSLDQYKQLRSEIKTKQEQKKKLALSIFKSLTKDFFKKYPDVESFGWHQYTMDFNDGDPCYFSAYTEYYDLFIKFKDEEKELNTGEHEVDKAYLNVYDEASSLIGTIDEEDLESLFGDPTEVRVFRDGRIEKEVYYQ